MRDTLGLNIKFYFITLFMLTHRLNNFRALIATTMQKRISRKIFYIFAMHLQFCRGFLFPRCITCTEHICSTSASDASPLLHADFPRLHGNASDLFYGTSRVRPSNAPRPYSYPVAHVATCISELRGCTFSSAHFLPSCCRISVVNPTHHLGLLISSPTESKRNKQTF